MPRDENLMLDFTTRQEQNFYTNDCYERVLLLSTSRLSTCITQQPPLNEDIKPMIPSGRSLDSSRTSAIVAGDGSDGQVHNANAQVEAGNHRLTFQTLILDTPIAPLMARSTAPFDRTERKKAHMSAVYYSECCLRGIAPVMADTAAVEAQGKYDKWWIESTASRSSRGDDAGLKTSSHKRRSQNSENRVKRRIKSSKVNEISSIPTMDKHDQMSVASGNIVSVSTRFDTMDEFSGGGRLSTDDDESMDGAIVQPESRANESNVPLHQISTLPATSKSYIEGVKMRMIEDLKSTGGSVDTPQFLDCLEILQTFYARGNQTDVDDRLSQLEGNWLTLSKPTYTELKGKNDKGESLYSLGRISFDMFRPAGLICSVQANFNNLQSIDPRNPGRPLHVPRKLMKDIWKGECRLQTYE
jgi:hypothetical protein